MVLDLGWTSLYPIQEDAIRCFLDHSSDFILAAPTSGGKTEAVFLPMLSHLVNTPAMAGCSVRVVAISPLKALINDQFARLFKMCKPLGIAVNRWHGDVDIEAKRQLRERPSGILIITPESLESLFINNPHYIPKMFHALEFVIVDELHALLDCERGMHVRSLLSRLTTAISHRPRCFGLSATLGDPGAVRFFLNQDNPESVRVISDRSTARRISVEIISMTESNPEEAESGGAAGKCSAKSGTLVRIAEDLREVFSDGSYLVFANSRRTVEELGDRFHGDCQLAADDEPAVVLHHGSLSARLRKRTESMLKSGKPTRALCTSSLELGIDIGAVEAVAQIDPTWRVSSLVQRLGRSGRKPGSTSRLRLYVRIPPMDGSACLVDLLYPPLLQAVAMLRLLFDGWLEPVGTDRMHLSTLVHQILSILKETGGGTPLALYESLCGRGPFRRVSPEEFAVLLQGLHGHKLIEQDTSGIIFLGLAGERVTSAPSFYAAFCTPVELVVRFGARELGRLPASFALKEGECLLLNGRRWTIDSVAWKSKSVWVSPAVIKKAPVFVGGVGEVHDRVFQEMRRVLLGDDEPEWLDENSLECLRAARCAAIQAELGETNLLELEDGVQWFPWVGTRTMKTLQLWAKHTGLECRKDSLSLVVEDISRRELKGYLARLAHDDFSAVELARLMKNKTAERFDNYVDEALLDKANSVDRLDLPAARQAARRTVS